MSKTADQTESAKTAEQDAAAKEKPADPKPWQREDWTGPLTADQAAWRRANIKPVETVRTK